ncbi:hypothetical protein F5Y19DRAFT_472227 [Xylariaceae sp. FL1651]|nr:hypothetical protein F5Y19DRAFT_472227 [Xylariaceae sp. FL1651]
MSDVEDGKLEPLAPFAYKAEGEHVAQLLWNEMMQELSFAKVEETLEGLKTHSLK